MESFLHKLIWEAQNPINLGLYGTLGVILFALIFVYKKRGGAPGLGMELQGGVLWGIALGLFSVTGRFVAPFFWIFGLDVLLLFHLVGMLLGFRHCRLRSITVIVLVAAPISVAVFFGFWSLFALIFRLSGFLSV